MTAYGTAVPARFGRRLTIDGQLGFGYNRYDQQRQIDFLGARAKASYAGQQYLASIAVGYALPGMGVTFTPYAGLNEAHLVNDAYSETGAGVADLSTGRQVTDTFSHDIGLKIGGAVDIGGGAQLLPTLKLGWTHDYTSGPIPITGTLGGVTFTSATARPSADGASVNAGVTFADQGRLRLSLEYAGDLRRGFRSHTGSAKLAWRF